MMSQDILQDAHERTDKEKVFNHDQKRTSPFLTLKSSCPKLTLSNEWGRPQVQGFHMLFQYPNKKKVNLTTHDDRHYFLKQKTKNVRQPMYVIYMICMFFQFPMYAIYRACLFFFRS